MISQLRIAYACLAATTSLIAFLLDFASESIGNHFLATQCNAGQKAHVFSPKILKHCLLDHLNGILSTNSFGADSDLYGKLGVILLRGSLFNHSANPNLIRRWNDESEQYVFTNVLDI